MVQSREWSIALAFASIGLCSAETTQAPTEAPSCGETVLVRRGVHGEPVGRATFSCRDLSGDGPRRVEVDVHLTDDVPSEHSATILASQPPSQITPMGLHWVVVTPVPTFEVALTVVDRQAKLQGPCSMQVGRPHRRSAHHPYRFRSVAWVDAAASSPHLLLTLSDDNVPRVMDMATCTLVAQPNAVAVMGPEEVRCAVGVMEGDGSVAVVSRCPGEAVKVHPVDPATGRWSAAGDGASSPSRD